jgi:creatinine amidohydrolase
MQLGERHWTQVHSLTDRVVVCPLGSLEQHGHHLPLLTDTLIITEIARRAEEELGDEALFLPALWLGASDHHLGMPGTVSAGNAHYVTILEDVLESLIGAEFRRIFLLNGHGGNITPGRQALYNVQLRHKDKHDLYLAFSSWWTIAAEQVAGIEDLQAKSVTHACEQETSMILRVRPELANMAEASGTTIPFRSDFYVPDFSRPSRVDVPRAFDQLSRTGAFGHPEIATAEKGESLFRSAAAEVVKFVREFARWPAIEPV